MSHHLLTNYITGKEFLYTGKFIYHVKYYSGRLAENRCLLKPTAVNMPCIS